MGAKKKYQEYLDSFEWKQLRVKAYERAGHKCELCRNEAGAVHHIKYPKDFSDDELSNLLVVCNVCHDKLHGKNLDVKQERKEAEVVNCDELAIYVKIKKDLQNWWIVAEDRAQDISALIDELDNIEVALGIQGELKTTKAYLLLKQERDNLYFRQNFIERTGALGV